MHSVLDTLIAYREDLRAKKSDALYNMNKYVTHLVNFKVLEARMLALNYAILEISKIISEIEKENHQDGCSWVVSEGVIECNCQKLQKNDIRTEVDFFCKTNNGYIAMSGPKIKPLGDVLRGLLDGTVMLVSADLLQPQHALWSATDSCGQVTAK